MRTLTTLLLALLLLPACASNDAGSYLVNRGGDLADCVRIHGMVGKGAAYKVEATRLLHFGASYYDNVKAAGLANREFATWNETGCSWGLLLGYHDEKDISYTTDGAEGSSGVLSGSYGWQFGDDGPGGFQEADPGNPLDLLTWRQTMMLGIGFDMELRVGEVVDFVAGIFQFDPAGDDGDYSG